MDIYTKIRALYFKWFKHYRRLELGCFAYKKADAMIRANQGKPESDQWRIAKEEDDNRAFGMVYLERRERIT
jgi:hypothetical protein